MLYFYKRKELKFIPVTKHIFLSIIGLVIIIIFFSFFTIKINNVIKESGVFVINMKDNFDEKNLVTKIKGMNFQFPYIVYAQSVLETDSFRSNIFKENNNLFGMKQAVQRINIASGTEYDHAYYKSWTESLYDYALYVSTYLSRINTEDEYYEYLSQYYAQDKQYCDKIKNIVINHNLKQMFK